MPETNEITTVDDEHSSRFEILVDGQRAGFALYQQQGSVRTFIHTMVFAQFEHRGLGSMLAQAALDDARAREYVVRPQCPFIAAYIREHPDYLDIVEQSYREALSRGSRP